MRRPRSITRLPIVLANRILLWPTNTPDTVDACRTANCAIVSTCPAGHLALAPDDQLLNLARTCHALRVRPSSAADSKVWLTWQGIAACDETTRGLAASRGEREKVTRRASQGTYVKLGPRDVCAMPAGLRANPMLPDAAIMIKTGEGHCFRLVQTKTRDTATSGAPNALPCKCASMANVRSW